MTLSLLGREIRDHSRRVQFIVSSRDSLCESDSLSHKLRCETALLASRIVKSSSDGTGGNSGANSSGDEYGEIWVTVSIGTEVEEGFLHEDEDAGVEDFAVD